MSQILDNPKLSFIKLSNSRQPQAQFCHQSDIFLLSVLLLKGSDSDKNPSYG